MSLPIIVIDTNVLVAALRSKQGSAFELLKEVGTGCFDFVLSVPLLFEYEDVLGRPGMVPVSSEAVGAVLDYLCQQARFQKIFYLWRPILKDPKDDLVLELAVNSGCQFIVTHNTRDFCNAGKVGVKAVTPAQFLEYLEDSI